MSNPFQAAAAARPLTDDKTLAARITARDGVAFEALMRQHNGRLFRVARAILKDDAEAEDVLQDAYLDAYRNMSKFRGDSQLGRDHRGGSGMISGDHHRANASASGARHGMLRFFTRRVDHSDETREAELLL